MLRRGYLEQGNAEKPEKKKHSTNQETIKAYVMVVATHVKRSSRLLDVLGKLTGFVERLGFEA